MFPSRLMMLAGALALIAAAWYWGGWRAVALVVSGLVMWLLLQFTRMMRILDRAAQRPLGQVDSAVMLHAQLQTGMPLLRILALTRSVGQALSEPEQQPEIFRWTDASHSSVSCEFVNGRLSRWRLERPQAEDVSPQS